MEELVDHVCGDESETSIKLENTMRQVLVLKSQIQELAQESSQNPKLKEVQASSQKLEQIFLSFVRSFDSMKKQLHQQAEHDLENQVIQDPTAYIKQ